jgi:uncharacterized protein YjeT (DUF2065 family)
MVRPKVLDRHGDNRVYRPDKQRKEISAMIIIVVIFGELMFLTGILMLRSPQELKRIMTSFSSQGRYLFAILFRLVVSTVLLYTSGEMKYSLVMHSLGALGILAAIGMLIGGQERSDRMVEGWMRKSDNYLRSWSVVPIVAGAFIIYATAG